MPLKCCSSRYASPTEGITKVAKYNRMHELSLGNHRPDCLLTSASLPSSRCSPSIIYLTYLPTPIKASSHLSGISFRVAKFILYRSRRWKIFQDTVVGTRWRSYLLYLLGTWDYICTVPILFPLCVTAKLQGRVGSLGTSSYTHTHPHRMAGNSAVGGFHV